MPLLGSAKAMSGSSKTTRASGASATRARPPPAPGPPAGPAGPAFRIAPHNDKYLRIAIRRLARMRGQPIFGNARDVRTLFDRCRDRQARRILVEVQAGRDVDFHEFLPPDLLGPLPTRESLRASKAFRALQKLDGLAEVKAKVDELVELAIKNVDLELREEQPVGLLLNHVFIGNPGTGKTTVAKLYGQILCDLGLLSKGEFISKTPSDFIGDALGQAEKKTRDIIASARGCVLLIDEAYLLAGGSGQPGAAGNDPYKASVVDTLVEQIQSKPGDDIAVILAGYKKEIEHMFTTVNPGLARRFPIGNWFVFADYDDQALMRILRSTAEAHGFRIAPEVAEQALEPLRKARFRPRFGNAGDVVSLLSKAESACVKRTWAGDKNLKVADFFDEDEFRERERRNAGDSSTIDELFKDLVACESVVELARVWESTIQFCKANNDNPANFLELNLLFVGAPGTGKTTVARKMGQLLSRLGVLPFDDVIEKSASDLMTGYVGQAGKTTRAVFEQVSFGLMEYVMYCGFNSF
eukprot:m.215795 g.215795  ORF g.215795 m.215795 type:complete len:526 (+) comp10150_c0_seq6:2233-3810(+)